MILQLLAFLRDQKLHEKSLAYSQQQLESSYSLLVFEVAVVFVVVVVSSLFAVVVVEWDPVVSSTLEAEVEKGFVVASDISPEDRP